MSPRLASQLLKVVSIVSFAMALVLASAAFAPIDGLSRLMLDLLDWPIDGAIAFTEEARWLAAIGGGLWASLSALYYLIVAPAIARGESEIRRGAIISILVWFVVDSAGSVAAGVPSNAVLNVPFLILFLVPLMGVRGRESQPAFGRA